MFIVHPAVIYSADGACDEYVTQLSRSSKGIVQSVQLFGSMMPPDCFLSGRELKDVICYEKLVLSSYAEKTKPVVTAVPTAPVSDHWIT